MFPEKSLTGPVYFNSSFKLGVDPTRRMRLFRFFPLFASFLLRMDVVCFEFEAMIILSDVQGI